MKIIAYIKILIIVILFSCAKSNAQEEYIPGSPYTIFGVGDIHFSSSMRTEAMGIQGISLFGNYVNSLNPASNSRLHFTTISAIFNYNFLKSSDGVTQNEISNGNVQGLNIGIPFNQNNNWVFSFGFVPFSTINYEIQYSGSSYDEEYTSSYSGKGGISRFYASMTYLLFKSINVGLEYNFAFGNITHQKTVDFENTQITSTDIREENSFNGSFVKGGIIFDIGKMFKSKSIKNLTLGAFYESRLSMSSSLEGIYTTSSGVDSANIQDGDFEIPQGFGFGITNQFGDRIIVSADVYFKNWSEYKEYGLTQSNLQNSVRAGIGLEYLSSPVKNINDVGSLTYRLGFFYDKAYYKVNNEDIIGYGINTGVNIPLNKYNSIDLNLSYFTRGKTDNGLIKDDFFKISAGVNFGELWFIRPNQED